MGGGQGFDRLVAVDSSLSGSHTCCIQPPQGHSAFLWSQGVARFWNQISDLCIFFLGWPVNSLVWPKIYWCTCVQQMNLWELCGELSTCQKSLQSLITCCVCLPVSTLTCGLWATAPSRLCPSQVGCPTAWARSSYVAPQRTILPFRTRSLPPLPRPRCTTVGPPRTSLTASTMPPRTLGWHPRGRLSPHLPCKPRPFPSKQTV